VKIGFYVPCYNAQDHIEQVLQAVLSQSLKPAEVLVVDDGSKDQSLDLARKYPVRIIEHKTNKGLAAARNTALADMKTDYIASVDADCVPEPDWLEKIMQGFKDQNIVGVGGRLKEVHDKSICDKWRAVHMGQFWSEEEDDPEFLFGSNTVFKRKALVDIGGYDDRFVNNFEDVDICRRIKAQGKKFIYNPQAIVNHLKQDSIATLLCTYWKWRRHFYEQEQFYKNMGSLKSKLADNMGLANRYLVADKDSGNQDLLYIDFLMAFDHSLHDFKYYIEKELGLTCDTSKAAMWMSFFDLVFFYNFDSNQEQLNSLMPQNSMLSQNLAAMMLIFGRLISDKFSSRDFLGLLWADLLESFIQLDEPEMIDKIVCFTSKQGLWDDFLKKPQANLNIGFLQSMKKEFNKWFNSLIFEHKDIMSLIKNSARDFHYPLHQKKEILQ
jgi:GT2 family glycosyltransferase